MRKWLKITIPCLLLAVGAVVCILRWQAWFGMPAEPRWNGETIDYVFPSPITRNEVNRALAAENDQSPITNDDDSVLTILVLGDIHSQLTRADYDTLAARVPQADAVAQVGDWMERGQDYYYQLLLREWTNSRLYGLPVIVTPGNHEYSKGVDKTLSPVWEHAFPHPHNGPVGVPGASYYEDLPGVRFICIDTNPLVRLVHLTRTLTWLRDAMNKADGRFVVVMMHHPVLSVGKGRANVLVYSAFRHTLADADLVLAGHDHSYMRRTPFVLLNTAGKPKPQKYHYTPDTAFVEPVYGVIQSPITRNEVNRALAAENHQSPIDRYPRGECAWCDGTVAADGIEGDVPGEERHRAAVVHHRRCGYPGRCVRRCLRLYRPQRTSGRRCANLPECVYRRQRDDR